MLADYKESLLGSSIGGSDGIRYEIRASKIKEIKKKTS